MRSRSSVRPSPVIPLMQIVGGRPRGGRDPDSGKTFLSLPPPALGGRDLDSGTMSLPPPALGDADEDEEEDKVRSSATALT